MRIRRTLILINWIVAGAFIGVTYAAENCAGNADYAPYLTKTDEYTLAAKKHLVNDYAATDTSGHINVVVEIPTGTNAKWEVNKSTGYLQWEYKKGKPRFVSYLMYPGNYGMIPRTLLPEELGGDGDPLDVIVLGPAVPRGTIIKALPIGVLEMVDKGEQDDKIIAVAAGSSFEKISSIEELDHEFGGVTDILKIWFSNYKGPGKISAKGFGSVKKAGSIIKEAIAAYKDTSDATDD